MILVFSNTVAGLRTDGGVGGKGVVDAVMVAGALVVAGALAGEEVVWAAALAARASIAIPHETPFSNMACLDNEMVNPCRPQWKIVTHARDELRNRIVGIPVGGSLTPKHTPKCLSGSVGRGWFRPLAGAGLHHTPALSRLSRVKIRNR